MRPFTYMDIVIAVLAASVPFGAIMTLITGEPGWLWFCLPIFIFLS